MICVLDINSKSP